MRIRRPMTDDEFEKRYDYTGWEQRRMVAAVDKLTAVLERLLSATEDEGGTTFPEMKPATLRQARPASDTKVHQL